MLTALWLAGSTEMSRRLLTSRLALQQHFVIGVEAVLLKVQLGLTVSPPRRTCCGDSERW